MGRCESRRCEGAKEEGAGTTASPRQVDLGIDPYVRDARTQGRVLVCGPFVNGPTNVFQARLLLPNAGAGNPDVGRAQRPAPTQRVESTMR